jgi:hypothetical protein
MYQPRTTTNAAANSIDPQALKKFGEYRSLNNNLYNPMLSSKRWRVHRDPPQVQPDNPSGQIRVGSIPRVAFPKTREP